MNGYNPRIDLHNLGTTATNSYIQTTNLLNNLYITPIDQKATITHTNPNFQYSSFLGYNDSITTSLQEISNTGSIFDFDLTNGKCNIVSTNNSDRLGSTGINQVLLSGVDANFNLITEAVNLNGITGAQSTQNFEKINSITTLQVGSNKFAVGDITFSANSSANIHCKMKATENNVYPGRFTVPVGYYASFDTLTLYSGLNDEIQAILRLKPYGLPILDATKYIVNGTLKIGQSSYFNIEEKTSLQYLAKRLSQAQKCGVIAGFYLIKK